MDAVAAGTCPASVVICLCMPSASFFVVNWQQLALGISGASVFASMLTSGTPTPAPGSRWAGVYRLVETLALVVGKAKDDGMLPRTPLLDRIAAEAVKAAATPAAPASPPAAG